MSAQLIFLARVPDADLFSKQEEARMYFLRRDRMNFKEGVVAGILATSFVLITILAIIGLVMWGDLMVEAMESS